MQSKTIPVHSVWPRQDKVGLPWCRIYDFHNFSHSSGTVIETKYYLLKAQEYSRNEEGFNTVIFLFVLLELSPYITLL